jgi:hypothetical protein
MAKRVLTDKFTPDAKRQAIEVPKIVPEPVAIQPDPSFLSKPWQPFQWADEIPSEENALQLRTLGHDFDVLGIFYSKSVTNRDRAYYGTKRAGFLSWCDDLQPPRKETGSSSTPEEALLFKLKNETALCSNEIAKLNAQMKVMLVDLQNTQTQFGERISKLEGKKK